MERVVDYHSVEEHLVLNRRAAADIKLTALVAGEHDARDDLQILRQVGLTAHRRDLGDGLRSDIYYRSLRLGLRLNLIGADAHSRELDGCFLDMEFLV